MSWDAPRVVTVVQARTGSSRLPGKALKPLAGKALILHALERAAAMGYPTWLATTTADADAALLDLAVRSGYPVWCGEDRDVLARVLGAARAAAADVVVRVTGDCPLFAPDVGRAVVAHFLAAPDPAATIATNDTTRSGYPDGLDVEVFALAALALAQQAVGDPAAQLDPAARDRMWHDREHVTPWLRRTLAHRVLPAPDGHAWRHVKLSVDTEDDLERVRQVCGALQGPDYGWPATQAAYRRVFGDVEPVQTVPAAATAPKRRRR